jgi:hypothetical protein
MKFVATKTAEQLDLQALHRVRDSPCACAILASDGSLFWCRGMKPTSWGSGCSKL